MEISPSILQNECIPIKEGQGLGGVFYIKSSYIKFTLKSGDGNVKICNQLIERRNHHTKN